MTSKHITRDHSSHKHETKRLYNEYVGLEIFSYNPSYTQIYLPETNTLKRGENATKTSWKSWSCYRSQDYQNDMDFTIKYNVRETGEYRIDFIYEQSNHIYRDIDKKDGKKYDTGKDLVGDYQILKGDSTIVSKSIRFDGENNILKRKTLYHQLSKGSHQILISVPHNCYFMGVIVRKIIKYTANNYYGDDAGKDSGNMMLTSASLTIADTPKPSELQVEIGYDSAFECFDSPSGFYIDYMDECNFYVKDDDGVVQRVFGGYVSSILPDDKRTKLTIHCADRLVDGSNKFVLDDMRLVGSTGDTTDVEYTAGMSKYFKNYAQALKYLCDIHEVTLKSNISANYLVGGEKYARGFNITFGKKKKVKKVKASNGKAIMHKNYAMLRNNSSALRKQVWTLYNAKNHAKKPPRITNYGFMHITYGLGSPKTTKEKKVIEKVETETAGSVGGSQKFTKCGVSADKKYVMAIAQPSGPDHAKYNYHTLYKTIFKNKCPYCGKEGTLRYDAQGNGCIHGGNKSEVTEGEITCISCDCDFCGVTGIDKEPANRRLTAMFKPIKSSRAERSKLLNGEMSAVPSTGKEISPDDMFRAITKIAFKYKYSLSTTSSYAEMKKAGSGDCWAFSDLIFTEMKKYGVACKIVDYVTNYSDHHRSVLYKNTKNQWVDFPYREYGWNTRYNNMLNNTSSSKTAGAIAVSKGTNIGSIKSVKSTSKTQTKKVTITKGFDKDKPFQGYLKLTYSLSPSFKAKKYELYVKFTLDHLKGESINSGLNLYWVNNAIKKATLKVNGEYGIIDFIRSKRGENVDVYLQSIHMIADAKKIDKKKSGKENAKDVNWYTYDDSTVDESSCKMKLYQIVFNDNNTGDSDKLNSCGKSVNSMMKELVDTTGYLVDMTYGKHRVDDKINFRVDNPVSESFTASEGDDNNILSWNSINYSPVSSLFNMSMQVYKGSDERYHYVDSRMPNSILRYQEQCTLATSTQPISDTEAYFNARMSDKYNAEQMYTYTITVPNYPKLRLGDLVKVVANARKLNSVKEVKSLKISFDKKKMPRIRTEIGLDELAPQLQLKKHINNLKLNAKKETTSFSSSAIPTTDESLYEWE